MKYRADIDGLRALAIIPVILFHAGITAFSGGFLGVDVFFVISGYLITSILLSDLSAGKFSIKAFYERRARRILPALFFVIALTTICGWFVLPPDSFEEYGQSAVAAILSVSNIYFWNQFDYFNPAGILKPLLHTWSLGIEEQFYIFFPIILFLCWKYARAYIEFVLIAGFVMSLALSEFMIWKTYLDMNFFLLPSRAWELIAGGYIAYRHVHRPFKVSDRTAAILSSTGFVMTLASMLLFNESMPHPGVLTLIPVAGAGMMIAFGATRGLSHAILSHRIPVAIGLISYSLYLWHQPVFSLFNYYTLNEVSALNYVALIAVSIGLAFLTYKFVETPFRNRSKINVKAIWISSAAMACLLLSVNGYAGLSDGLPSRFSKEYQPIFAAHNSRSRDVLVKAQSDICKKLDIAGGCIIGDSSAKPTWALIGDSHSAALGLSLDRELKARRESAYFLPRFGCAYLPDMEVKYSRKKEKCPGFVTAVRETVHQEGIKNVVILNRYVSYYTPAPFDNMEGGTEIGEALRFEMPEAEEAEFQKNILAAYQAAVTDFIGNNINVYLIYPVPEVGWDVPMQMFKRKIQGVDEPITTSYEVYHDRVEPIVTAFDALEANPHLHRIDPSKLFCNSVVKERCVTQLNGKTLYFDDDHLSIEGADLVVRDIIRSVDHSPINIHPAAGDTY